MSVEVRPADAADIDPVCELLHTHMSARISREGWRRLLDYPWRPADADRGRVAVDGGKVVGFLGLVYADRELDGRIERFCNICAWYLLKPYRGQGIGQRIQLDAIADDTVSYTLVTATDATARAFAARGFQVLDKERFVFRPGRGRGNGIACISVPGEIAPHLHSREQRILDDHLPFNLRHLLFMAAGHSCYVVMQVKRKGEDIAYHEVMYASDHSFLAAHAQDIADVLLPGEEAVLAIDRRFLPGTDAERESIPKHGWFRSPHLRPQQIDHLYNEIVLLDLKLP